MARKPWWAGNSPARQPEQAAAPPPAVEPRPRRDLGVDRLEEPAAFGNRLYTGGIQAPTASLAGDGTLAHRAPDVVLGIVHRHSSEDSTGNIVRADGSETKPATISSSRGVLRPEGRDGSASIRPSWNITVTSRAPRLDSTGESGCTVRAGSRGLAQGPARGRVGPRPCPATARPTWRNAGGGRCRRRCCGCPTGSDPRRAAGPTSPDPGARGGSRRLSQRTAISTSAARLRVSSLSRRIPQARSRRPTRPGRARSATA